MESTCAPVSTELGTGLPGRRGWDVQHPNCTNCSYFSAEKSTDQFSSRPTTLLWIL